jgi:F420-non-reducing hydrogenase large subunit
MTRTITIDPVTRIEGHARILLDCDDSGKVEEAFFCVNELRGFERILVGMQAHTLPQITARICGVCPTAHHLVAAKALDNLVQAEIPPAARMLRELMYMGHVIHSHALSLFILAGPDLVFGLQGENGAHNIVGMADKEPELARNGLRLRTIGQKINETIGGRGIHPITAVAGGISFRLSEGQQKRLQDLSREAEELIGELYPQMRDMLLRLFDDNPSLMESLNIPSWYLGTVADGGALNFYDGRLRAVDENGQQVVEFSGSEYRNLLVERTVSNSYAKEVYFQHGGAEHLYRVSTLARLNVVESFATPKAQREFELYRARFGRPCHNTIVQMYAKLVELLYACENAAQLSASPILRDESRVPVTFRAGRGVAHIEAPRGTLIHDYEVNDDGIVTAANMIIATQQNTAAINMSLRQSGAMLSSEAGEEKMLNGLEFVVRCYDPCLACSTHAIGKMALEIEVRNRGAVVRRIRRNG